MVDSQRNTIHLVQFPSPKPQHSADPKDIAAEVLGVVRECRQGLFGYRADADVLVSQMGGLLDGLEAAAVRAMKQKA